MCSDCTIRLGATMNEILLITEWSRWHCVYFPDIICEVHRRGFLWWRLLTLLIVWQTTICVWCRQLFSFFFFVCDEDLTLFIVWQTTISCFGWIMFKCKVHRCQYLGEDWQFCVHLQSPQILVSVVKVNKWRFSSWKSDVGNYLFFCRHWLITAFARQQLINQNCRPLEEHWSTPWIKVFHQSVNSCRVGGRAAVPRKDRNFRQ